MFDGGVFSCRPRYRYILIVEAPANLSSTLKIGLSIKPWESDEKYIFTSMAKQLVLAGACDAGRPLTRLTGASKCLLDSISYVGGDVSNINDVDGPFSAWDFNTMIYDSQDTKADHILKHVSGDDIDLLAPTQASYVCHDADSSHYFAFTISGTIDAVEIFDNQVGVVMRTTIDTFHDLCSEMDVTFFYISQI